MLSQVPQPAATTVDVDPASRREVEFARALDRYMASYAAERRPQRQRQGQGGPGLIRRLPREAVRRLTAFALAALERLGSAMSGGGRFPPPGIM